MLLLDQFCPMIIILTLLKSKKYSFCTEVESEGKPWCSTKVDSEYVHVPGEWDYCSSQCSKQ